MMKTQRVAVIGLGYVGIPVACIIAQAGNRVIGIDTNKIVVDKINSRIPVSVEQDVVDLFNTVVKTNPIKATTSPESADVFIICVPTPLTQENLPDLSYVNAAVDSIAPFLAPSNLLIIESTVPV